VRPDRITMAAEELGKHADAVSDQVGQLRGASEKLLREHRKGFVERQFQQKRLAAAVSDIYAQAALLSRVSAMLEEQSAETLGQEMYIADTFCGRAAARVEWQLERVESNDDERMTEIAKLALKRGGYGYALFDD
jgi:acyl-CoA dehydrogenase family protein 9